MTTNEIYNAVRLDDRLVLSGQPTEDQLREVAAEGFTVVINLAPYEPQRSLPDEAGLIRSLNMQYIHIPVIWQAPTPDDFAAFEQAMNGLPPTSKTLIHCVANFRVSAFYSLYAQKCLNWTEAQAEALRAKIWQSSDNPIWEDFVAQMRSHFAD